MASLKDFTNAECGGANPLMRLTQQLTSSDSRNRLQDISRIGRPQEDEFVTEFLTETRQSLKPPSTFRMDTLMSEINSVGMVMGGARPKAGPRVADLVLNNSEAWTSEFIDDGGNQTSGRQEWSNQYLEHIDIVSPMSKPRNLVEVTQRGLPNSDWVDDYLKEIPSLKEQSGIIDSANNLIDSLPNDPIFSESEFIDFVKNIGEEKIKLNLDSTDFIQNDDGKMKHDLKWAEELNSSNADQKQKLWTKFEEEWKENIKDSEWLNEFQYEPHSKYEFQEENPFISDNDSQDNSELISAGKMKLDDGDLPSAVLIFEAAVQRQPESWEAWSLLGTSQQQNENDSGAISALLKAIQLQPKDIKSLMALAVSYTNESYQSHACTALQKWIKANDKYVDLANGINPIEEVISSSFMTREKHQQTLDLFLKAARQNPESLDPDVQCGLGILFNLISDYDKAIDCFRAAVNSRPNDALLWNKLGATLANGNRSEEAIEAYHNALSQSPGFVRARYNIGVSCINLKAYREAIEHFLIALNFQFAGRGPNHSKTESIMSDNIWTSLRLAVSLHKRPELLSAVDDKQLSKLSKIFNVKT